MEDIGQVLPLSGEEGSDRMNKEMDATELLHDLQVDATDPVEVQQIAERTEFDDRIQKHFARFREEMFAEMQAIRSSIGESKSLDKNGIQALMIGATFNCPICDLRIIGPSLTGQKGVLYEHPFDDSPKLSGRKCELKGQKFKSPVVYLQFATPRPLTGKTE